MLTKEDLHESPATVSAIGGRRKLIFLDIDGTLTMPGKAPSEENVRAIQAARRNGHLVFLCTGRAVFQIDQTLAGIGFDGGIYHAGGRVLLDSRDLVNQPMAEGRTDELIRLLTDAGTSLHLETADGLYDNGVAWVWDEGSISGASSELLRQVELRRRARSKPMRYYAGQPIYKISFVAFTRPQQEMISARIPSWANLVWFDNLAPDAPVLAGEVSDLAVTKATAMEAICRAFDASPADCIAFGDSMNDAAILEAAGLGVAMGNSSVKVKAIADMVCEACTDNGIAKALRRMGLA